MRRKVTSLLFSALALCALPHPGARAAAAGGQDAPPLRYWFWWEAPTFDTYRGDSFDVMQVARNIYAPLVSIGVDGLPQGMLAESWSVDSDGSVWRFKLRKGLAFESGAPVTPDSVLKNFKRMLWLTRREKLPLNSLLPGLAEWAGPSAPLRAVELAGFDLVFRFGRRPENLFEILSHPIYGVADPACFDDKGQWREPFCPGASGQYAVAAKAPGRLVMSSRGVFDAVPGSPASVELLTPEGKDKNAVEAMLSGRVDLSVQPDFALSPRTRRRLEAAGVQFTEEPPSRMYFFQLNHLRPPFSDPELRRSVRDVFLTLLAKEPYFEAGHTIDPCFMPRGGVGYAVLSPESALPRKQVSGKAEIMLVPLASYAATEDGEMQAAAEQAFLKTLKLHGLTPVISRYTDRKTFRKRNEEMAFDALLRGSGIVINDPYSGLKTMFMSKISAMLPDPSGRAARHVENAIAAEKPETKREELKKMNAVVFEDAALITFMHSSWVYIHKSSVDMGRFNLFMDPIEFRAIGWKF